MNIGKESETLEYKKSTGEIKQAMDDICSILNKHGKGVLYFGVKPNGDVCGQDVSANTLDDVARYIKTAIKPMIYPCVKEEILDGLHVIRVDFLGSERPYSSYGKYYKRVHDRAEDMTPDELKHMMLNTDYSSIWENNQTMFGIDDVDKKALLSFYKRAVSCGRLQPFEEYNEKELLTMLGLMIDDKLTNAGYFLFSSKEPTVLKMAVYATDQRIKFLDINRVRDNIYNLIDIAVGYISEHMNWRVEFDGRSTTRNEIPEVPIEAIREIVVNAFAHANYRSVTEHEIDITPTMIDIYNPGEFPINYKPEDFADRRIQSMPRNKKILDILYRSKNVEIQGSGIRKVLELCAINDVRYTYYNNEYGFRFSFYRRNTNNNNINSTLTNNKTNDKTKRTNPLDTQILSLLKENPIITREELAQKVNKTERTIQRSLERLKDEGKIVRIGNKVSGYWEIIE